MKTFCVFALCILILWLSSPALGKGDNFYRAAVLELVQFDDVSYSPSEVIKRNFDIYDVAAKTASQQGVDIIIFPECGLYPCEIANRSLLQSFVENIPDPHRGLINPCQRKNSHNDHPILKRLSCMAKDNGLYIVANVVDIKPCDYPDSCDADTVECRTKEDNCPEDGMFLYNTNIVFDREGSLITKYYKKHLFFEKMMNVPHFKQDGYFQTDFGSFTTVICFDLVFKDAIEDVQRHGVMNLAYPTYWYDHVPYIFFATPYQQAWAMMNKVNLLAANGHEPRTGTLGSGIFSANRGALIYTNNPDDRTKLLISNVPSSTEDDEDFNADTKRFFIENGEAIEGDEEEDRDFRKLCGTHVIGEAAMSSSEYRCHPPNLDHYKFVKLEQKEGEIKVCSNDFCCFLSYSANSMDENYFLGITGNELNFYDTYSYGLQTCFLVRCEPLGGHPCMDYVLQSHTVFRKVELVGNFTAKYIYPFAVNSEVRLTDRKDWKFDGKSSIVYSNSKKISSLIFLGLHGRMYENDKFISKN